MAKYKVEVNRHYTYQIEIEAKNEYEAYEQSREWEIEDLEPFEVDAWFSSDIIEYPQEQEAVNA